MNQGAINLGNPVSSSPLNRGLVGWWLAMPQQAGGARLMNLCQGGTHGTLVNSPTWGSTAGRSSGFRAIDLNGTNQYATIGASSIYHPSQTSPFTIAMWFNPDTISATANAGRLYNAQRAAGSSCCFLGLGSTSALTFTPAGAGSSGTFTFAASFVVSTWYHIAVTYTGSAATSYVNGTLDSGPNAFSLPTAAGSSDLCSLGSLNGGASTFFDGRMDDVVFANRAWSSDEVRARYNDSRTGYPQTLNRLPRRSYAVASGGGGGVYRFLPDMIGKTQGLVGGMRG